MNHTEKTDPTAPKPNAHQRAKELDALITPEILAQWQAWRDEGKPLKWIARNCGIPGLAYNTINSRLLRHQEAANTPPVQEQPRPTPAAPPKPETAVVTQPTAVPDWLPADFQERIEAFKRDMQAIGIPVNIGVNVIITKEIRL